MNKISSVILLLLITVCLGMPQQYDDDYEEYLDTTDAYDEEEEYIYAPAVQTVFKYKSQNLTVTEGENVDLSCETETPNYDAIIFKQINGTLSKDQIIYVGGLKVRKRTSFTNDDSVFKLTNIKRTDGGTYICYYYDNVDTELRFKLDVQYPPTVKAKTPLKQRVEKGDSVTVECEANGNPKPTIKWSKESGRLPSGNQEEMGYSMTLENVDRHVEGTYICTADNGIGEPASTSMKLTVEYPPEITTEKLNESTNLPGEWTIVNVTIPEDDVSSSGLVHKMKHTIDDLTPATDYVAVVSVKNKYKWEDEGTFPFSTRKASPTTTTTIATSTTYPPFAEEKVQYPYEETMSLHKTGGADLASLNTVLLILSFLVLSLKS